MKTIALVIALLIAAPAYAELAKDEQEDLFKLVEFCFIEIPGSKQKDYETAKRAIFGEEAEKKQLVDDFRRKILIPQAQQAISFADQMKAKAQTDLTTLQDKVK